jgi:aspartokinase
MFGLVINKTYYISLDNWATLIQQSSFTIKDMNNLIKDLHLEKEVSLMNEDEAEDENQNKWIQRNQYFDYCLEDCKKGQSDIIKSVGKTISSEIMDKIIDSCGKSIRIQFLSCTQTAYETD